MLNFPMKNLPILLISAFVLIMPCAFAQTLTPGAGDTAKTDPGIVNTPPDHVDMEVLNKPSAKVDPDIAVPPPKDAKQAKKGNNPPGAKKPAGSKKPARKKSHKDDCRGPAELCKQDSAR
jgi:hypothetical protein